MEPSLDEYTKTAELLKAIAHPVRLCIVKGLLDKGRCNVGYIQACLELPQSTVSQHLQKLRVLNIITAYRNGLEIYYEVTNPQIAALIPHLFARECQVPD